MTVRRKTGFIVAAGRIAEEVYLTSREDAILQFV
jgi:hypothetical protein